MEGDIGGERGGMSSDMRDWVSRGGSARSSMGQVETHAVELMMLPNSRRAVLHLTPDDAVLILGIPARGNSADTFASLAHGFPHLHLLYMFHALMYIAHATQCSQHMRLYLEQVNLRETRINARRVRVPTSRDITEPSQTAYYGYNIVLVCSKQHHMPTRVRYWLQLLGTYSDRDIVNKTHVDLGNAFEGLESDEVEKVRRDILLPPNIATRVFKGLFNRFASLEEHQVPELTFITMRNAMQAYMGCQTAAMPEGTGFSELIAEGGLLDPFEVFSVGTLQFVMHRMRQEDGNTYGNSLAPIMTAAAGAAGIQDGGGGDEDDEEMPEVDEEDERGEEDPDENDAPTKLDYVNAQQSLSHNINHYGVGGVGRSFFPYPQLVWMPAPENYAQFLRALLPHLPSPLAQESTDRLMDEFQREQRAHAQHQQVTANASIASGSSSSGGGGGLLHGAVAGMRRQMVDMSPQEWIQYRRSLQSIEDPQCEVESTWAVRRVARLMGEYRRMLVRQSTGAGLTVDNGVPVTNDFLRRRYVTQHAKAHGCALMNQHCTPNMISDALKFALRQLQTDNGFLESAALCNMGLDVLGDACATVTRRLNMLYGFQFNEAMVLHMMVRAFSVIHTSSDSALCMNTLLRGDPSTGKSEILRAVMALLPESMFLLLSSFTPKALYHLGSSLLNKILASHEIPGEVMGQPDGKVMQGSRGQGTSGQKTNVICETVKSGLSEGSFVLLVTMGTNETGFRTMVVRVDARIGLYGCYNYLEINAALASRMLKQIVRAKKTRAPRRLKTTTSAMGDMFDDWVKMCHQRSALQIMDGTVRAAGVVQDADTLMTRSLLEAVDRRLSMAVQISILRDGRFSMFFGNNIQMMRQFRVATLCTWAPMLELRFGRSTSMAEVVRRAARAPLEQQKRRAGVGVPADEGPTYCGTTDCGEYVISGERNAAYGFREAASVALCAGFTTFEDAVAGIAGLVEHVGSASHRFVLDTLWEILPPMVHSSRMLERCVGFSDKLFHIRGNDRVNMYSEWTMHPRVHGDRSPDIDPNYLVFPIPPTENKYSEREVARDMLDRRKDLLITQSEMQVRSALEEMAKIQVYDKKHVDPEDFNNFFRDKHVPAGARETVATSPDGRGAPDGSDGEDEDEALCAAIDRAMPKPVPAVVQAVRQFPKCLAISKAYLEQMQDVKLLEIMLDAMTYNKLDMMRRHTKQLCEAHFLLARAFLLVLDDRIESALHALRDKLVREVHGADGSGTMLLYGSGIDHATQEQRDALEVLEAVERYLAQRNIVPLTVNVLLSENPITGAVRARLAPLVDPDTNDIVLDSSMGMFRSIGADLLRKANELCIDKVPPVPGCEGHVIHIDTLNAARAGDTSVLLTRLGEVARLPLDADDGTHYYSKRADNTQLLETSSVRFETSPLTAELTGIRVRHRFVDAIMDLSRRMCLTIPVEGQESLLMTWFPKRCPRKLVVTVEGNNQVMQEILSGCGDEHASDAASDAEDAYMIGEDRAYVVDREFNEFSATTHRLEKGLYESEIKAFEPKVYETMRHACNQERAELVRRGALPGLRPNTIEGRKVYPESFVLRMEHFNRSKPRDVTLGALASASSEASTSQSAHDAMDIDFESLRAPLCGASASAVANPADVDVHRAADMHPLAVAADGKTLALCAPVPDEDTAAAGMYRARSDRLVIFDVRRMLHINRTPAAMRAAEAASVV